RLEKQIEDRSSLLTAADMQAFEISAHVTEILAEISNIDPNYPDLTTSVPLYNRARNVLIALILLRTGHRSGVIANFTVQEFLKAEQVDGYFLMHVGKHKTADTQGPSKIIAEPLLYEKMQKFYNYLRPLVAKKDNSPQDKFFLTMTGDPIHTSYVSN